MKKIFTLILVLVANQLFAQNFPGFSVTNIDESLYNGGTQVTIQGKTPDQLMVIGQYAWGWSFCFLPGSQPFANIAEFYVPNIFSIMSSTHTVHPLLGIRDKDDSCDLSLRMNATSGWGEIRVGNAEGDYPGFYYDRKLGIQFIVNDGNQYIPAVQISSDGFMGIGTEKPLFPLHIQDFHAVMMLDSECKKASGIVFADEGLAKWVVGHNFTSFGDNMWFVYNNISNSLPIRVLPNNNVGINIHPRTQLDVGGDIRANNYRARDGSVGISTNLNVENLKNCTIVIKNGLIVEIK